MNKQTKRETRGKLSRDRIVDAALALLDRDDAKGFSMRKLAGELGVDPMALYHYHANRKALIADALDTCLSRFDAPPPSGDWRADLRATCHAFRRLAHAHPGAFRAYELQDDWIPAELVIHEAFMAALARAGLSEADTVRGFRLLLTYVEAFAVDEISGWLDQKDAADHARQVEGADEGALPEMRRLARHIGELRPEAEFEFGLDVLIDGLEARRDRR